MSNVTDDRQSPPPRAVSPGHRVPLKRFWHLLPASTRRRTLATLSRMVTQLAFAASGPHVRQEVDHDRH